MPDESTFEPKDNGRQDEHRAVIERPLLITRSQAAPLLEPIDAALDDVATGIDGCVEDERTPRARCPLGSLVTPLGNGVFDLSLAQHAPTARIAIALVGDEPKRAGAWPSSSTRAWDANAVQYRPQLRAVMALAWCDDDRERPSLAVAGEVQLGRQPSTAPSQSLVGRVLDPLFTSAWLGRRRAPLAC